MPRPIIAINTYAGSLLVAAKRHGSDIVMSLEDHGYGVGCQRMNFPRLNIFSEPPWPTPNLSETIAIAHPPCACFSAQACGQKPKEARGVNSDYFLSTKMAIEHALSLNVPALAVESVVATLEGARPYHDEVAERFGYNLYRIIQNAITFGLPQWRPRFWAIFMKRPNERFIVHHRPVYRSVGEVLQDVVPGAGVPTVQQYFNRYKQNLAEKGLDIHRVLQEGNGYFPELIARFNGEWDWTMDLGYSIAEQYGITSFSSAWPIQLDPGGMTHTLMRTSHWWYQGRPLTAPEYNALAGFPRGYAFDKPQEQLDYLSRGVAPPVAEWILDEVERNLDGAIPDQEAVTDQVALLKPGETADLRISKLGLRQMKLFNLEGRNAREHGRSLDV